MSVSALLLALACATPASARDNVVVLLSDDLREYQEPLEAFRFVHGSAVEVINLNADEDRAMRVAADLRADPPPAILALGAKAAWTARHHVDRTPLVYAMVFDPRRYGIDGAQVTGVGMQVPPDMVLSQFQLFAPDVKRLGLIISTENTSPGIGAAIEAAKAAGYDVTARRIGSERDVRRTFIAMRADVDAVWLVPDRTVLTPQNFHFIKAEAQRAKMPLLSWSAPLVEAGALMCVAPDRAQIGAQAADLIGRVTSGETAGAIEPQSPALARVVLNRDAQDAIGLQLEDGLLDFVDEVVRAPTRR